MNTSLIESTMNVSCYPNPFTDYATVSFELNKASEVGIQIFNLQGNRIKELSKSYFPLGNNEILLRKEDLTPGIYILRLISNQSEKNIKILIN